MNPRSPASSIALTARDLALIEAVTCKVKMLSFPQIKRTWWCDSKGFQELRRRLSRMEKAQLIRCVRVLACEESKLAYPMARWQPGDSDIPDLGEAIGQARLRWSKPLHSVRAVVGTPYGADLMGGKARRVRPSEGSHDLHLAQVYLNRLIQRPADAIAWVGEAQLVADACGQQDAIPDAAIRHAARTVAVEVVGSSYTAAKLRAFHDYCRIRDWSYELW